MKFEVEDVGSVLGALVVNVFFEVLLWLIGGWAVQIAWNNVIPYLFHLETLSFWHAFSLFGLIRIIRLGVVTK